MQINAYLSFDGQCEAAFQFYEQLLGGKNEGIFRYAGTPMANQVPPEWGEKIMHIRLTVGTSELMGADSPPEHGQEPAKRFCMSIGLQDPQEADRIFHALAENGFGMLADRFGIPWMINCEAPK